MNGEESMNKPRKISALCLSVGLLFGLTPSVYAGGFVHAKQPLVSKSWKLSSYDSIEICGPYDIVIKGEGTRRINVQADQSIVNHIHPYVHKGTLIFHQAGTARQQANVHLGVSNLRYLHVCNGARVVAKNISSDDLVVEVDHDSSVRLRGMLNLTRLMQKGAGKVDMLWLNSDRLILESHGAGSTKLAGMVSDLRVKLHGRSVLDTRYLRAKQLWIQTFDSANAKILAVDRMNTFTYDNSEIHFYKTPDTHEELGHQVANVLQMGHWS